MTKRALASAGTLAAVIALVGMSSAPLAGQARTAPVAAKKYVAPPRPGFREVRLKPDATYEVVRGIRL